MEEPISPKVLKELCVAGAVRRVTLTTEPEGFVIVAKYGAVSRVLAAKRGHVRYFKTVDAAARFARRLGLSHMDIDMTNWSIDKIEKEETRSGKQNG